MTPAPTFVEVNDLAPRMRAILSQLEHARSVLSRPATPPPACRYCGGAFKLEDGACMWCRVNMKGGAK